MYRDILLDDEEMGVVYVTEDGAEARTAQAEADGEEAKRESAGRVQTLPALSYRERSRRRREKKQQGRLRFLLMLVAAAWLFVIVRQLAGLFFERSGSLAAAFTASNAGEQEGVLEIMARYTGKTLTEEEKKEVIYTLAGQIGLEVSEEPQSAPGERRSEVSYEKRATAAQTKLSVISLTKAVGTGQETEDYVYARLCLNSSIAAVAGYKELLEDGMRRLGCEDISTTIRLTGTYEGYLTLERRNRITDEILAAMGGEIAYEHREDDLYTVYAYTALLPDYIMVEGKKINLHIAMSKDEEHYRTIVYLASPILPDTW